ncbi:hypothetical protein EVB74_036 [Rhizobium phage RHph_Y3_56_1]|nr:hypothetical protein EVB59_036 [Rhizobium phage RHph_Y3_1]QIG77984.1 hypothetical protein EVB74_036 [Rhizobium phage RHph_Y3_56_1]
MPWVRFTADYDWRATPAVTLAYKADTVAFVTTPCAAAAKAAGKAEPCQRPKGDNK